MGGEAWPPGAGGRGRLEPYQCDGWFHRDRPPLRSYRCATGHHAFQRDGAARGAVWPRLDLCPGGNGARDGAGEPAVSAFTLSTNDGIAVLTLDVPGEPVNALGSSVLGEFEGLLAQVESDAALRALVLLSGKPDNFIAGADIQEFTRITSAEQGEALARSGQELMNRLARFPKPVVVGIHGACVGLGCELSLTCAWRVASDSPKTVVGLPAVQIGILPAAGGCQRLPRGIGVSAAPGHILDPQS